MNVNTLFEALMLGYAIYNKNTHKQYYIEKCSFRIVQGDKETFTAKYVTKIEEDLSDSNSWAIDIPII